MRAARVAIKAAAWYVASLLTTVLALLLWVHVRGVRGLLNVLWWGQTYLLAMDRGESDGESWPAIVTAGVALTAVCLAALQGRTKDR